LGRLEGWFGRLGWKCWMWMTCTWASGWLGRLEGGGVGLEYKRIENVLGELRDVACPEAKDPHRPPLGW
jgi:hypothetical protein